MGEMLHDQMTGKYQRDLEITRPELGDITDGYCDNVYHASIRRTVPASSRRLGGL
jgi:hypothetical protein